MPLFDKLFGPKNVGVVFDDSTEIPAENAQQSTVEPPTNKPGERYRLEIEVTYNREYAHSYPYQGKGRIFDTLTDDKHAVHMVTDMDTEISIVERNLITSAGRWIKEQKIIDKGPSKKTVYLPE